MTQPTMTQPTTSTSTSTQNEIALPCEADNATLRKATLERYGILDTGREQAFDDLTWLAATTCKAPFAVINFIDTDRQWFKSEIGFGINETALDISICAHALLEQDVFVVPDTHKDNRFCNNPLVTGDPALRFYAGALLRSADGIALGTLCVLDTRPRRLSASQQQILRLLANQVMQLLELYRVNHEQAETVRQLQATREQLRRKAATDPLTGLFNRRAFDRRLQQEYARMQRTGSPSSLLMADLDHFKQVNDAHGHQVGDQVLVTFAQICQRVFREYDVICRWGGEEFLVLLPDTDTAAAERVAERLHNELRQTRFGAEREYFSLTTSVSILSLNPSVSMDKTISRLDAMLYEAKHSGRNTTVTHQPC